MLFLVYLEEDMYAFGILCCHHLISKWLNVMQQVALFIQIESSLRIQLSLLLSSKSDV